MFMTREMSLSRAEFLSLLSYGYPSNEPKEKNADAMAVATASTECLLLIRAITATSQPAAPLPAQRSSTRCTLPPFADPLPNWLVQ